MAPPLVGGGLAALELLWSRTDLLLAALIGSGSLSQAEPSFSNTRSIIILLIDKELDSQSRRDVQNTCTEIMGGCVKDI
jgi:hypothetical protein